MKLPHGDKVIIDQRKVVDYCLSPDHDDGKHKARLFENLGLEHGTGHLTSMSPPKNQRFDTGKG